MHRGWMDHDLFKDRPYSEREAWEHMIAHTSFAPSRYRQGNKVFDIPRGDLPTHYRRLADKWQWSPNSVIAFLKLLKNEGMITLKTEHGFLQVTICKYEEYQNPHNLNCTENEQELNAKRTQTDTNIKKDKELKEIKESIIAPQQSEKIPKTNYRGIRLPADWEIPQLWGEWAEDQGLTEKEINLQADKFKDWWISKAGAGGVKSDWQATWRNWIRTYLEGKNYGVQKQIKR